MYKNHLKPETLSRYHRKALCYWCAGYFGKKDKQRCSIGYTWSAPRPLLLWASVLDYGSPLFYVITKAANSFWQLWPVLKITEQLHSLMVGAISLTFFTPALSFAPADVDTKLYLPLFIPPLLYRSIYLTSHLPHSWWRHWSHFWFHVSFMEVKRDNIVSCHKASGAGHLSNNTLWWGISFCSK